ncbi:hypothetical protein HYU09_05275 [Candidatus Woesearchaeota archaeon]|nr:hypothetical protein [Candidatus Woesearchaeota archaeon]
MAEIIGLGNLSAVSIAELVDSGNVEILTKEEDLAALHKNQLKDIGARLKFYVDRQSGLSLPLRMRLVTAGHVLMPNMPVSAVTYEQYAGDGVGVHLPWYEGTAIVFPENKAVIGLDKRCGYAFDNKMRRAFGKADPFFAPEESGWKSDQQGRTLETNIRIRHGDYDDIHSLPRQVSVVVKYDAKTF